ncbi:hypothetical protein [Ectothiorhodospira shaposhnikovii]|uniref:hypothetical protein n=1 Tax=Ectothiorhodospira shaposhnikovii TaxID=1054 RepID=UPI001F5BF4FD|nr:hypothetical protein [Ectothiorhodospira shaposhnikovii]
MTRRVKPESEAARQEKAIRSASVLLLFIARDHNKRHWVDLGRGFERVALAATSLGIAHAHVNMPCEVEPIRRRLASHLALTTEEQPLLLIRLGYTRKRPPLKLREIWALRTRLELAGKIRELALFNLAIDSKLRGCDLVQLRVNDVARAGDILTRASVVQQKTREPVRFELTEPTRVAVAAWCSGQVAADTD